MGTNKTPVICSKTKQFAVIRAGRLKSETKSDTCLVNAIELVGLHCCIDKRHQATQYGLQARAAPSTKTVVSAHRQTHLGGGPIAAPTVCVVPISQALAQGARVTLPVPRYPTLGPPGGSLCGAVAFSGEAERRTGVDAPAADIPVKS